jgi:hypothetical protein
LFRRIQNWLDSSFRSMSRRSLCPGITDYAGARPTPQLQDRRSWTRSAGTENQWRPISRASLAARMTGTTSPVMTCSIIHVNPDSGPVAAAQPRLRPPPSPASLKSSKPWGAALSKRARLRTNPLT